MERATAALTLSEVAVLERVREFFEEKLGIAVR